MPILGRKIECTHAVFSRLVRDGCLLVDKSLIIKEFFEAEVVALLLRPRRFGKTLTLSMLQHFFSAEVAGVSTADLFSNFAIAKVDNGEFMRLHQGQYPVISITFKDLKEPTLEEAIDGMRVLIQKMYREHQKLLRSEKLSTEDKALFQTYLSGLPNKSQLEEALQLLSEFLYKAHGKKAIILIDEYDSPLTAAYVYGYVEELSNFMRNVFSSALKDNIYLEKALMSGILRVSKNQMLSELNNLKVYTSLDDAYGSYFGFTEAEVAELVEAVGITHGLEDIRRFYNGYFMGKTVVYNPWSLLNYLSNKELGPYWVLTSNDTVLRKVLVNSSEETKDKLSRLMQGENITDTVDVNLRYEDLIDKKESLWTLLLFAGYLTVVNKERDGLQWRCQLRIPNLEVLAQYTSIFRSYLTEDLGTTKYDTFLKSLLAGKVEQFTALLSEYLLDSFSVKDTPAIFNAENIYHALMLGLVASIRETHHVDSKRESGTGFYDLLLTPKTAAHSLGILLELKYLKITSTQDPVKIHALLKEHAERGLKQIEDRQYETVLKRSPQVTQRLKVCMTFSGKNVLSLHQFKDLNTKTESKPQFCSFERKIDKEY